MNVIFLDIDGVLNCGSTKERCEHIVGIEDNKVKILKEIVDRTNSKIILISSWKTGWNRNYEECDVYAQYLIDKLDKQNLYILDKTTDSGFNRGEGIYNWLDKHNVDNWIVIDDEDNEIFEDYDDYDYCIMKHLIKTEFCDGLTRNYVSEAIKKLGENKW